MSKEIDNRVPPTIVQWIANMADNEQPLHIRENYFNSLMVIHDVISDYCDKFQKSQHLLRTKRKPIKKSA